MPKYKPGTQQKNIRGKYPAEKYFPDVHNDSLKSYKNLTQIFLTSVLVQLATY